jgi:hypothetical protein
MSPTVDHDADDFPSSIWNIDRGSGFEASSVRIMEP